MAKEAGADAYPWLNNRNDLFFGIGLDLRFRNQRQGVRRTGQRFGKVGNPIATDAQQPSVFGLRVLPPAIRVQELTLQRIRPFGRMDYQPSNRFRPRLVISHLYLGRHPGRLSGGGTGRIDCVKLSLYWLMAC